MQKLLDDVRAFHLATDTPVRDVPGVPTFERRVLRHNLLQEEWGEFIEANERNDVVGVADALADMIYVAVGTALEYGIPLDKVWAEVQRTNMAKVDPATGKVSRREDGKILKPEGWTPPDVKGALGLE
jgi:predicted HAD superfamily Cof-like phosphohydrolase